MSVEENPRLLAETIFESAYGLFRVQTDEGLINRMSWIAVIFTIVTAVTSVLQPTPYGKMSTADPGRTIRARFSWMIQELPGWVVPLILVIQSPCSQMSHATNVILVSLFALHHFQRTMVYPMRISKMAKPIPISTMLTQFVISTFNGLFQTHHLINVEKVEDSTLVILGTILFIFGMVINIYYDGVLMSLKSNRNSKDKMEYQIPSGSLFEYVSGANYFGEILEWWGFAIASGKSPQLIFAIFSTLFLSVRAWDNHEWYKKLFGKSFPPQRKALIPFII